MRLKNRLFWVTAMTSLLCDRLTKLWVVLTFVLHESIPLVPGVFHFTYVTNTGAAFSLFSGGSSWLRWFSLAVSLALVAVGLGWFGKLTRWEEAGWGLILAGALGNGVDRFLTGEVVDFLDFRLIRFPVFNVADVSINLGVACLVFALFRPPARHNGDARSPGRASRGDR